MDLLRDPVSSASHFLTAFFAIGISLFLVRMTRGDSTRRFYVLIFACCMTALYLASGLYHAVRLPAEEIRFFQLLDMSAIYLMIAGSATPVVALLLVPGRLRTLLLAGVWTFAIMGILALWVLPQPDHDIQIACYMGIGWLGCAGLGQFWRATGWAGARWFVAALACYMAGAFVELMSWPVPWPGVIGAHEILHFCDIGGTACYLVYLIRYVIPYCPPVPAVASEPVAAFVAPAQV